MQILASVAFLKFHKYLNAYSKRGGTGGFLKIEVQFLKAQVRKFPLLSTHRVRIEHFCTIKESLIWNQVFGTEKLNQLKISQLHINMVAYQDSTTENLFEILLNNAIVLRSTSYTICIYFVIFGAWINFTWWLDKCV